MLGTILTISSSSWLSAWMGLEINLIRIAPLLINKISFQSVETSIKYFLIQAIASTILILFIFISSSFLLLKITQFSEFVITLLLIIKAGVAPLHFWFPQVITQSGWMQCLLIITWQKVAPFVILSFLNNVIIRASIIFSSVVGILGGINQTNVKLILTYSSIIHSAWILTLISTQENLWVVYITIYTFLTISVVLFFIKISLTYINTIFYIKLTFLIKTTVLINFLSIAGLPPFIGFIIKVVALIIIFKCNINLTVITFLIVSSFISFYFYSRLVYSSLFLTNNSSAVSAQFSLPSFSFIALFPTLSLIGGCFVPFLLIAH